MTRTELQRRELEEAKRHNQQQEKIGLYGAVASGLGSYGSILRGAGAILKKPQTNTRNITNNTSQEHFHSHHDDVNVNKYYGGR